MEPRRGEAESKHYYLRAPWTKTLPALLLIAFRHSILLVQKTISSVWMGTLLI
jgi:hypothetical protein